ncbi:glycosyltransferase family 4 protein [Pedobacter insulae]|uniref:Glycosyltransferase involved in cell wall bisynthesis n=1 Tax=Pedobacter insulae TaxID=414048 RepID=A0A1I2VV86_9SPHI|nr:glycosyltransferase family 4 protein [Pedobacter insulae]SFG93013.1 Glycosyltransferase involved in cell wall bisynthesis [Pedobacter insulae]
MKNNSRVLFLTLHTFSLTGGIEKVCRCVAKALSDILTGTDFSLLSLHDKNADLDTRYLSTANFEGFSSSKVSFGISSLLKGIRSKQVILSHINLLLFAMLIKFFSPQTKIILFAHGIEVWRPLSSWKKKFLHHHVEIWAVSSYTASKLVEMHQLEPSKIKVLNNGLDPLFELPHLFEKPLSLLKRYNINENQPTLFTLTRLSSQETYKGYDRVIMAIPNLLKKFPTLHYFLAGKADKAERKRVEDLIEQLNLKANVTLIGFVKDEELLDHYQLGDIFIMPSTMEGFGIVFIEAAACGAQIIGGNKDGSVDALLNGKMGTLIDPSNSDEMTVAIENNLINKKEPRLIQDLCIENFSYAKYVDQVKKLILC